VHILRDLRKAQLASVSRSSRASNLLSIRDNLLYANFMLGGHAPFNPIFRTLNLLRVYIRQLQIYIEVAAISAIVP
jgi:hypothetical protein